MAAMQYARHAVSLHTTATTMSKGMCVGLLIASFSSHQALAADVAAQQRAATVAIPASEPAAAQESKRVDFERESASKEARQVADWVADSGDNHSLPFVIVDKVDAKVFVFNADGRLLGATPALLGAAHGDDSVPDIGKRKLSRIRPEERTTPAGRFVAVLDRNLKGKEILWVDYDTSLSLHPVITSNIKEQRAQRLASPSPLDNRISYGCINVPDQFFKRVLNPAFNGTKGVVYILPETRSLQKVFASYEVNARLTKNQSTVAIGITDLMQPHRNQK